MNLLPWTSAILAVFNCLTLTEIGAIVGKHSKNQIILIKFRYEFTRLDFSNT